MFAIDMLMIGWFGREVERAWGRRFVWGAVEHAEVVENGAGGVQAGAE